MKSLYYPSRAGALWHHYLHGNVPGHELDWIARPVAPALEVAPQHLQHLLDLVKHHDAPSPAGFHLTVGNLSLADSTHVAGRGALGIILHFRVPTRPDHGGRRNPRVVHILVSAGKLLTAADISAAIAALVGGAAGSRKGPDRPIDRWYEQYHDALVAGQDPLPALEEYLAGFAVPAALGGGPRPPERVAGRDWPQALEIDCQGSSISAIIPRMAALAEALYHSTLRWSALTTSGRRPGGDQGLVVGFLSGEAAQQVAGEKRSLEAVEPQRAAEAWLGVVPYGEQPAAGATATEPLLREDTDDLTDPLLGRRPPAATPPPAPVPAAGAAAPGGARPRRTRAGTELLWGGMLLLSLLLLVSGVLLAVRAFQAFDADDPYKPEIAAPAGAAVVLPAPPAPAAPPTVAPPPRPPREIIPAALTPLPAEPDEAPAAPDPAPAAPPTAAVEDPAAPQVTPAPTPVSTEPLAKVALLGPTASYGVWLQPREGEGIPLRDDQSIPAGVYTLKVNFGDGELMSFGKLRAQPDRVLKIRCDDRMRHCHVD